MIHLPEPKVRIKTRRRVRLLRFRPCRRSRRLVIRRTERLKIAEVVEGLCRLCRTFLSVHSKCRLEGEICQRLSVNLHNIFRVSSSRTIGFPPRETM